MQNLIPWRGYTYLKFKVNCVLKSGTIMQKNQPKDDIFHEHRRAQKSEKWTKGLYAGTLQWIALYRTLTFKVSKYQLALFPLLIL